MRDDPTSTPLGWLLALGVGAAPLIPNLVGDGPPSDRTETLIRLALYGLVGGYALLAVPRLPRPAALVVALVMAALILAHPLYPFAHLSPLPGIERYDALVATMLLGMVLASVMRAARPPGDLDEGADSPEHRVRS